MSADTLLVRTPHSAGPLFFNTHVARDAFKQLVRDTQANSVVAKYKWRPVWPSWGPKPLQRTAPLRACTAVRTAVELGPSLDGHPGGHASLVRSRACHVLTNLLGIMRRLFSRPLLRPPQSDSLHISLSLPPLVLSLPSAGRDTAAAAVVLTSFSGLAAAWYGELLIDTL